MEKEEFLQGLRQALDEGEKIRQKQIATYMETRIDNVLKNVQNQIKLGNDINKLFYDFDVAELAQSNIDLVAEYLKSRLSYFGLRADNFSIHGEDFNSMDKGIAGYIPDMHTMLRFDITINEEMLNTSKTK